MLCVWGGLSSVAAALGHLCYHKDPQDALWSPRQDLGGIIFLISTGILSGVRRCLFTHHKVGYMCVKKPTDNKQRNSTHRAWHCLISYAYLLVATEDICHR